MLKKVVWKGIIIERKQTRKEGREERHNGKVFGIWGKGRGYDASEGSRKVVRKGK